MKDKEPFREAMRRPGGMIKSAGFKDDPRYRGGHLTTPGLDADIILKPNLLMLIPRVVLWVVVYFTFSNEYGINASAGKFFLYSLCILDIICAIPKFFFERTILRPDGIERTLLFHKKFFRWEIYHQVKRDPLGLTFRSKPAWGIWKDEFNFIISWLYYSPSAIRRVADLFPLELGQPADSTSYSDSEGLMNINA